MAIDLTVSEEEMEDSSSAPSLREGYIGPANLENIELDEVGDDEYPVIRFTFTAQDEDHIGQEFEHLEWAITDDDIETIDANGQSNAKVQLQRMVHMLSRLLDTDENTVRQKVVLFQGDTLEDAWEQLRQRVKTAYENYGTSADDIHVKAYATVNSGGYVDVQFGKYPGFIRVVGEDPKLEFTNWEREQNLKAQEALNSSPDGDDEFMADDEDDFDFEDADF